MKVVKTETDMTKALSRASNRFMAGIENELAKHNASDTIRQATWMVIAQMAMQKAINAGFPIDKVLQPAAGPAQSAPPEDG